MVRRNQDEIRTRRLEAGVEEQQAVEDASLPLVEEGYQPVVERTLSHDQLVGDFQL